MMLALIGLAGCRSPSGFPDHAYEKLPPERIPWYFPDPRVPPPRFPPAHPDANYKEGMTPLQYFEHLCRLEAGEFISRTVDGVDGIYLLRPRFEPNNWLIWQREAMEDPFSATAYDGLYYSAFHRAYTLSAEDRSKGNEGRFVPERSYKFTEKPYLQDKDVYGAATHYKTPIYNQVSDEYDETKMSFIKPNPYVGDRKLRRAKETQGRYLRYVRNWPIEYKVSPGGRHYPQNGYLIERRVDSLKSRYGVAWRGIKRPRDREMGIGGGELYVIDLATNEIIAYRRGFIMGGKPGDGPVLWKSAIHCPLQPGFVRSRKFDTSRPSSNSPIDFIKHVLIPSTSLPEKE
jgi:hypothetical protein